MQLESVFEALDWDNDGTVDRDEFIALLSAEVKAGQTEAKEITTQEIEQAIRGADTDVSDGEGTATLDPSSRVRGGGGAVGASAYLGRPKPADEAHAVIDIALLKKSRMFRERLSRPCLEVQFMGHIVLLQPSNKSTDSMEFSDKCGTYCPGHIATQHTHAFPTVTYVAFNTVFAVLAVAGGSAAMKQLQSGFDGEGTSVNGLVTSVVRFVLRDQRDLAKDIAIGSYDLSDFDEDSVRVWLVLMSVAVADLL